MKFVHFLEIKSILVESKSRARLQMIYCAVILREIVFVFVRLLSPEHRYRQCQKFKMVVLLAPICSMRYAVFELKGFLP